MVNKAVRNARNEAQGLIEMYQAGFLDGFNNRLGRNKRFRSLKKKCIKAFEKRFKQVIKPAIEK